MSEGDDITRQRDPILASGLVSADRIAEAMAIHENLANMGVNPGTLAEILVQKGYLTEKQAASIAAPGSEEEGELDIPGYEILGTIGKGGMGTVYKGFQKSMARDVAIKVLFPETARLPGYVDRFFHEARIAARVKHTNIIQAFDVGEHRGHYFLVMEYFPGRTLKTVIYEEDRIAVGHALDIVLQVARALEHAHQHRLIHRDVKPENILLNEEGVAKLCDMGLAKEWRPGEDQKKELAGTPLYLSPEQGMARPDVDIRSDLYSLGATFYHMILGRPPFIGADTGRILRLHREEPVVPPAKRDPSIPKALSDVIVKLMAKKPEDRFPHPTALIAHLERVRDALARADTGVPPPAADPKTALASFQEAKTEFLGPKRGRGRARRGARTQTALWGALAMALLVAAAGGVLLLGGRGSDEPKKPGTSPGGPSTTADAPGPDPAPEPPPAAPDPVPAPLADPAAKLLEEALAVLRMRPDDFEAALPKFREAAAKGGASAAGVEAARRAVEMEGRIAERDETRWKKAAEEAGTFEAQGRHGWAATVWENYLLGALPEDRRARAEEEVGRIGQTILTLWQTDRATLDAMLERGEYDDAKALVNAAVDVERGYATKDVLRKAAGEDVDALLATIARRQAEAEGSAANRAGPLLAALEQEILDLLATGRRRETPTAAPLALADRFRAGLQRLREAADDEAFRPAAADVARRLDEFAAVVSLLGRAEEGFRALASSKGELRTAPGDPPRKVVEVTDRGGQVFVRLTSPPAMTALHEAVLGLSEAGWADVCTAAAESGGMSAEEHLGLGLWLLWSTPGEMEEAPRRAKTELEAAGTGGLDVARHLAVLETRGPAMAEASILRRIEAALELAKSGERKDRDKAQAALEAILADPGGSPAVASNRAKIEDALRRLKAKEAPPAEEAEIPSLKGKALSFDPSSGAFEIRYEFSRPTDVLDWTGRTFGNNPEAWFQKLLDDFLGRRPAAQLSGGRLTLSGGGYWVWNPRLEGDVSAEMEIMFQPASNFLVQIHCSDAGGYAFHTDLDFKALQEYARTAGVEVSAGAFTGISTAKLSWPQTVTPLDQDHRVKLAARTWYKLVLERRGNALRAEVLDRRMKPVRTFEARSDLYGKGRFAFVVMKGGAVVDNLVLKGRLDADWRTRAEQGRQGEVLGDMPGDRLP